MKASYILDILRTPIGKYGGALSGIRPDDLAARSISALLQRNPKVDPSAVEDVILGAANQAGEDNRNVARMASLLAGLPVEVAGITVNRLCASSLQAIMDASRCVALNEGSVYLAGGVESMSRAPFVMAKPEKAFDRNTAIYDTTIGWRFVNPKLAEAYFPYSMGETAENIAERWQISREEQDEFAYHSQRKYQKAEENGRFDRERIAVEIPQKKAAPLTVTKDEHPRFSPMDVLARLRPVFRKDGTVTAGNASGVNDGAAIALVVSEEVVKDLDMEPMARVVSMAVAGVDPDIMGIGPVPATRKALQRAGLRIHDLDLIELNEAFAAQSIACIRDLELDPGKVNVKGGAIALGHPLGASGARISATLLHGLAEQGGRYGLATMCVGVGQGAAMIYENLRR